MRGASLERRKVELDDDRALLDKRMQVLAGQVEALKASVNSRRATATAIAIVDEPKAQAENYRVYRKVRA